MAAGGMADIFLGHKEGPRGYESSVVIKMLRGDWADEPGLRESLVQEARMAAQLDHPNIARVLDVGESSERPYLVMEFLFGRTLQQVLERAQEIGAPLEREHIEVILSDALAALERAHAGVNPEASAPIIHRDVSPSNLFIGFDGVVRLLDFGLAKDLSQVGGTRTGVLKGKYAYMSPEQARRLDLDLRSDLFSAGVVLWELLTQQRLFDAHNELETLRRVIRARTPFPKFLVQDVSFRLSWVAFRALSRSRRLRFPSAAAMQKSLLGGRTIREQDRDALQGLMEHLFHVELYARDLALQRARTDPQYFRKLRDSGFELLPEVTDPALPRLKRGITTAGTVLPRGPAPTRRPIFGVALAALLAISLGIGVFVGRTQPNPTIAHLYLVAPKGAVLTIGSHQLAPGHRDWVPVEPGRHRIVLKTPNRIETRWVQVAAGQRRLVDFKQTATSTASTSK